MHFSFRTIAVIAVILTASCQREQRNPRPAAARFSTLSSLPPESALMPGGSVPQAAINSPYEGNAWAISEGQTLYRWFNCAGCHSGRGGGGIGPALNDNAWIYGGEPAQIFDSIARGRPNGMPAWGSRIPQDRIWQLVAYVRSLSNEEPKTATPPRADSMESNPSNVQNKVRGETR